MCLESELMSLAEFSSGTRYTLKNNFKYMFFLFFIL